jgi:uncharacterized protein
MESNPLKAFSKQSFLNLETYKKSGVPVRTPVWFAQDGEKIFVRTIASSGKVKRIKNSTETKIAPCTVRGEPLGEWIPANARLSTQAESTFANRLLARKYGLQKMMFDFVGIFQRRDWAVITLQPGE